MPTIQHISEQMKEIHFVSFQDDSIVIDSV